MTDFVDWQEKIWSFLKEKGSCFVRLSRNRNTLFVTDFPARHRENGDEVKKALENQGLIVCSAGKNGALWEIDLNEENYRQLLSCAARTKQTCPHEGCAFLCALFEKNNSENTDMARYLYRACFEKKRADTLYGECAALYAVILRKKENRPGKGCAGLLKRSIS